MSFFQVDDKLHVNEKARALTEAAVGGDLTGLAAIGLWTIAGSFSRNAKTDGKLTEVDLMKILLNKPAVDLLAARLVSVGLWHAPGHDCEKCPVIPKDSFVFHDWFQYRYDTAADEKLKEAKAKELKDDQLRAQVWARDATDFPICSRGKCRYCGVTVFKKTTRGDTRHEIDHVDPKKACGVQNMVLVCAACNRKKGKRTPEEAGMVLRPAPAREEAPAPSSSTIAPEGSQNVAPEPSSLSPAVELGDQDLAASFGLTIPSTTETAAALSSLTIAPEGSQNVAPEQPDSKELANNAASDDVALSSSTIAPNGLQNVAPEAASIDAQANGEPSEAYAWMSEEDPDLPAALTKVSTKSGPDRGRELPNPDQPNGAVHGPARAGARAGGVGRGGDGQGVGQGAPSSASDPSKPRRSRSRRKRGKRGNQQVTVQKAVPGDAPQVLTGGRFGSPYNGVHGWQPDVPNSVCELHGLNMPCWKCEDEVERKYREGEDFGE